MHKHFIGGGQNNFFFITKAYEIARQNPGLFPRHIDVSLFDAKLLEMKELDELNSFMKHFALAADIACRYKTDLCYHEALSIYGFLEEAVKSKVYHSEELLKQLRTFLHHEKSKDSE